MSSIKILVNGIAGVGKTSLVESFGNETFVISRDAKNFMFPIPHMLVDKWYDMATFLYGKTIKTPEGDVKIEGVQDKLGKYFQAMGKKPENVVIDSVSQIWMDVIEKASLTPNVYGSQGAEVTKEMGLFVKFVHEFLELNDINVILLNHIIEEKVDGAFTGTYLPFGTGKFKDKGGFYSTVNESVTIALEGDTRFVYTNSVPKMARTTLKDIPQKMYVKNIVDETKSKKLKDGEEFFSLKEHIDKLKAKTGNVAEFRL